MERIRGIIALGDTPIDAEISQCEVTDITHSYGKRTETKCPKTATFVIKANEGDGFLPCCADHKESFLKDFPDYPFTFMTLDEWKAEKIAP